MNVRLHARSWRASVTDVAVFGAAFGLTNLASYLYLVLAGRTLSTGEFGVFNSLFGLISILGVVAASLQVAVTQAVVTCAGRSVFAALLRATWRIVLPGLGLLTLSAIPFASKIGADATQTALSGIAVLMIFLSSAAMGFLGGLGRVRSQAFISLLGTLARLGIGGFLIFIGLGIGGALVGYVVNYAAVFSLAYGLSWYLAPHGPAHTLPGTPAVRINRSAIATFVFAFAPFSLDQLAVQAVAPALGDNYAALTTMAKIVFYGAFPIMGVVYPRLLAQSDERRRQWLLATAAAGVIVISGSFAWGLSTFPGQSMGLFFGERYREAVPNLGLLAFGVACFAVSALGAHALIAWGNPMGFLPSLIAIALGVVLFVLRHDSLAAIVSNQVWVYGTQLILMLALFWFTAIRSLRRRRSIGTL